MKKIPAEHARIGQRRWLDAVQYRGEHIAITRLGDTAAIAVPETWYRHALTALGQPHPDTGQNTPENTTP